MSPSRRTSGLPQQQAAVVTARCLSTPVVFGIRMQHDSASTWSATWAFAISAERAAREGYTDTRLSGSFALSTGYPGCPGCGNPSFAQCFACHGLGCWSTTDTRWKCPACGRDQDLGGTIREMSAGAD
ncbi:MAG TPA: hypothetical protein VGS97_22240 [Actinocrinis sp.]|uniref:hypothetical protein n=1 Tax=Actinocrinis sp. TaxID=1920516 RepID=UPI002DDD8A86|nr:hypothetical protein [Actinocrinis sp.]HEV2346838.1 hypothetical protein [Actinocrinis sp.]